MTSKLTRLTDDELTETLRLATSGYPLPAWVEGNLRQAFAELQERLKADSEPVAYIDKQWTLVYYIPPMSMGLKIGDKLYRHAQPAPVVPNGLRLALSNAGIAAPESDEMLAATCEKHIQALVTWVKDRKPFQSAPVVPSFEEWLSAANRKPLGWVKDAMREAYDACRAAMLQAGNSPVIPDGYVMMPKEPTQAMCAAFNDSDYGRKSLRERYVAMLAAAQQPQDEPQNIPEIIPGWIPVSERMPEDRTQVILWDAEIGEVTSGHYSHKTHTFYHCGDAIQNEITHWMPLPAAPQEVSNEK